MLRPRRLALAIEQGPWLAFTGRPKLSSAFITQTLALGRSSHDLKTAKGGRKSARKKTSTANDDRVDPKSLARDLFSGESKTASLSPFEQKLQPLQDVAASVGISKTGPKAALVQRLKDTLRNHSPPPPDGRILSIDLGIRNLAYALLTPGLESPNTKHTLAAGGQASISEQRKPVVRAWNRVDLASLATDQGPRTPKFDSEDSVTTRVLSTDFTPPALSSMALRLVREHLLPLNPTHIVIEKQRFRSGGGSSVLEWTVRVNSLESMLYAAFATLKSLGHFDGVVIPVDPRRVGPFLLSERYGTVVEPKVVRSPTGRGLKALRHGGVPEDARGRGAKSGMENKKLKIGLVAEWLTRDEGVAVAGEAAVMKRIFLRRLLPKGRKSKPEMDTAVGEDEFVIEKLDDVADCLLQGVAWLRWEENKSYLLEKYGAWLE